MDKSKGEENKRTEEEEEKENFLMKNSSVVQSVSSYIKPRIHIGRPHGERQYQDNNSDIRIDTASPVCLQFWRERERVFSTFTVVHTN